MGEILENSSGHWKFYLIIVIIFLNCIANLIILIEGKRLAKAHPVLEYVRSFLTLNSFLESERKKLGFQMKESFRNRIEFLKLILSSCLSFF